MLDINNLHAYYDNHRNNINNNNSHILQGINLHIASGEIVSVLGRNVVGRSTLAKSIMGLVSCTGSVRKQVGGAGGQWQELVGLAPHQIAHFGVGYVPEHRDIFPTLTVEQNLTLGLKKSKTTQINGVNDINCVKPWGYDDMYVLFPALKARQYTQAGLLSGGEQQMLTLCRTLMGNPDLIIIDEPTEGLAPKLVMLVAQFLYALKQRGVAVLLIEQKLTIALDIANRVYVLGQGRVVFEGTPAAFNTDIRIKQEWLAV